MNARFCAATRFSIAEQHGRGTTPLSLRRSALPGIHTRRTRLLPLNARLGYAAILNWNIDKQMQRRLGRGDQGVPPGSVEHHNS